MTDVATGLEDLATLAGVLLVVGTIAAAVARFVSKGENAKVMHEVKDVKRAQYASMRVLAHVIPNYQETIETFNPEIARRVIQGKEDRDGD